MTPQNLTNRHNKKENILLIGSYGRGNIGDDAFLVALTGLFSNYNIYINHAGDSKLPNIDESTIKTIPTEFTKDFWNKIKIFFSVKYIIYGGGDVWVEMYGSKKPYDSLYKMILVNLVARLTFKKVFYFGVGAGKITGYARKLAIFSAKLANYSIFRESETPEILGMKKNYTISTDITSILLDKIDIIKIHARKDEKTIIGLSLMYFIPHPEKNFIPYINQIADIVNRLDPKKYKLVLIPFLFSDKIKTNDIWVSNTFAKLLNKDIEFEIFNSHSITDCLELLKNIDLVIGTRLHANILSTLTGTPCVGISYRPKVRRFFQDHGLKNYWVSYDKLDDLEEKITDALENQEKTKDDFKKALERIQKEKYAFDTFINTHLKR